MVSITLPDGSIREFDSSITGAALAADIGPGLAKAAIAIKVDGVLLDLAHSNDVNAKVEIVTRDHDVALTLLRHDAAHVMAQAVQELYTDTQVTFGPATDDGFYYDFHRTTSFTPEDLEKIELRMRDIVKRDEAIIREVWDLTHAARYFE